MINLVTDASPWIAFFEGKDCTFFELALNAGLVEIPALVKVELLGNAMSPKDRKLMESFLSKIPTVGNTEEHLQNAAQLKAELQSKKIHISARDAHILQCARDRNAILVSSDPLFTQIQNSTGVRVQLW